MEPIQSNISGEKWKGLKVLASDKTIAIKAADKVSSVVVWDSSDYLQEASGQFQDKNIYEDVRFSENILVNLIDRSNKILKRLCSHKLISEKKYSKKSILLITLKRQPISGNYTFCVKYTSV